MGSKNKWPVDEFILLFSNTFKFNQALNKRIMVCDGAFPSI